MQSMTTHDSDLHAWALDQARLLRTRQFEQLDLDNLADEIEDLGKSEQRELASRMAVLLAHLLKWQWQAERRCSSWEKTIRAQRKEIRYSLDESPSLRPRLGDDRWVDMVWARALAIAVTETGLDRFPDQCPWSLGGAVLDLDWMPQFEGDNQTGGDNHVAGEQ